MIYNKGVNSSRNDKIFHRSNFKAFADDIFNVVQIMICVPVRIENIVEKGENAGYQHFLLFPQCFQKASLSGSLKVGIMRKKVKSVC